MSVDLPYFQKIFSRSKESQLIDSSITALELELGFQIKIRRSARARRITLRVCQVTGGLKITIPSNLKISVLRIFINKNMNWIRTNLKNISPPILITDGVLLPIKGQDRKVFTDVTLKSCYILKETELILPTSQDLLETQVKSVLKQIAGDYFSITCDNYAERLGVSFSKISIKDPKSRWGSCSSDKKLMFSWRLIMAPLAVSSYVAAHEIAHLLQMNHSQKYWNVVGSIYPNYRDQRNWLRENGRNLHKFVL